MKPVIPSVERSGAEEPPISAGSGGAELPAFETDRLYLPDGPPSRRRIGAGGFG